MAWISAVFFCLGAADTLLGDRLGLGSAFRQGFAAVVDLLLLMTGFMALAPWLGTHLAPVITPVFSAVGCDPSLFASLFLSCDAGGAVLAAQIAQEPSAGLYNGLIVAAFLGSTINGTIPLALGQLTGTKRAAAVRGLFLGFLVLPPRLLERYRQELGFYACTVPALEQHVLARFIAGGHYERHLSRMRKEYRDRRSATISAFRASPLASHVTFSEEGAGLHFLLRLDTNRSDEELRRLTAEAGIRLSFLSEYAAVPDPRFAHTLVINYAGLSQSDLEEALQLLTDVLLPLLA